MCRGVFLSPSVTFSLSHTLSLSPFLPCLILCLTVSYSLWPSLSFSLHLCLLITESLFHSHFLWTYLIDSYQSSISLCVCVCFSALCVLYYFSLFFLYSCLCLKKCLLSLFHYSSCIHFIYHCFTFSYLSSSILAFVFSIDASSDSLWYSFPSAHLSVCLSWPLARKLTAAKKSSR